MPSPLPEIQTFNTPEALALKLAAYIADLLQQSIEDQGRASLVVSGGSTPKPFFEQLSRQDIAWQNITVTLADERWVDRSDTASNERLVRATLLQHKAATAHFIPLKNAAETAASGEAECQQQMAQIPRPFTVVILGMGNDGHTASFFPGSRELQDALDMQSGQDCVAITPLDAPHQRMTLTLPALLNAEQIILHITGPEKHEVLQTALAQGPVSAMPVRAILRQQKCPVQIYWAP